jgi:hypothetical protein
MHACVGAFAYLIVAPGPVVSIPSAQVARQQMQNGQALPSP